jgi:hypothetical protein
MPAFPMGEIREDSMPTLTQYWFHDRFFGGPFDGWNQPYGGWAWISNSGGSAATLAWNRQDDERVIDLGPQLNSPGVLSQVDQVLGSRASRTSGIMVQGVFWPNVPYHDQDPGRHNDGDMLARVYFNFHIGTPWYCSDADGNISYYLVLYLDGGGHIQGYVDGWSYDYSGGGPFCTGSINDALNSAVPNGMATLQTLLNGYLALLSGSTFSMLYYLPGSGTKAAGPFSENADLDLAVAVLP